MIKILDWKKASAGCHPKHKQPVFIAKIENMDYDKKKVHGDFFWCDRGEYNKCECFYREYNDIGNIVENILGFPKDATDQAKGKHFSLLQRELEKIMIKMST